MSSKYEVTQIELPPQPCLIVRGEVAPADIGDFLARNLPLIFGQLEQLGAVISGAPFLRYFEMSLTTFDLAAGLPIAAAVDGTDTVQAHELPGGPTLTAVHVGPYADVGGAWDAIEAELKNLNGAVLRGGWDSYTNDPTMVAPEAVETQLFQPIRTSL